MLVFNILRRLVWSLQGTDCWARPGEKCGLARGMALPGGGLTPKSATCINCSGIRSGEVPKWLRERSAKPLFRGSNPLLASSFSCLRTLIIGQLRRRPIPGPPTRGQLPAVERKNRSKPAFLTRTLSIMSKSACLYHLVALCMESSGYRLCWARPAPSDPESNSR